MNFRIIFFSHYNTMAGFKVVEHELDTPPPRAVIVQEVFLVTGTLTVTEPVFPAPTFRELF